MRYLLDVNVLIALAIDRHKFHRRVEAWVASLKLHGMPKFATCSITELGFIRIVSQVDAYNISLDQAKLQLALLKKSTAHDFRFVADNNDISLLPSWVKTPKQTTDGHLAELALRNGATLATLDENIPGSFVPPQ